MTVMAELVVWLLAVVGCSALLVTAAERWTSRMNSVAELSQEHYRLLVHNSEQVLERAVRRLLFRSYWSGKPIRITLIEEGSTDDTSRMLTILAREPYGCGLCMADGQTESATGAIVIDLRKKREGA
ncbi:glycosyltransferase family 2 protein [Brevibacillus sp. SAFN-007a]|uniref:glycosyltransferase family 2 protein n=1 Tax=Brevibacillus sp. SAFN-007a TaxID=3436862 RepID=UPI003F80749D